MRLYKDGVLVGSLAKSGLVDANAAVAAAIGHQPPGAGQQAFDGKIDDVRLYRAALTQPEIQALITGGNQVPVAMDDGYSVDMDDSLVVDAASGVLANDSDLDLEPLTAQLAADVAHGTLALAGDGSFTYTPDPGYSGADFFTYRATDGQALSNLATVTLTVIPPAGADVVAHYRLDEGSGTTAADSAGSADGTLDGPSWTTDTPDGSPYALSFDGSDDRVDLGGLDVAAAGMTIACWLRPDGFAVRDARLVSKATGVQENQHWWMLSTIFNGATPTLRFRLKTNGSTSTLVGTGGALSAGVWAHAAAVYDGAAMRLYLDGVEIGSLPKAGPIDVDPAVLAAIGSQPPGAGTQPFLGSIDDVRIYRRALSAAEVAGLVSGNASPVAQDDGYSMDADTVLVVDALSGVLDNDSDPEMDPLTAILVSDVSNGTLALAADGSFTYTPLTSFAGIDQFQYRASDGNSASAPATVTITVNSPSGGPPVAFDDAYGVEADGSLVVTAMAGVLSNDMDPDLDPLTAELEMDVADGTLSLASDGSFTYTPDPGFSGTDTFTYRARDGFALSNPATVTITVSAPPGEELEAHWRFDEGAGSVASDSSGEGRDGTVSGPGWTTDTPDGSPFSLSFDGVDDRIDIGAFDVSGDQMTIACWLRPDGFSIRDARLVSKATGVQENDHYWMLSTIFRGATPTLRFRLKTGGSTTTLIASTGELQQGVWAHAAAVYDGSFMRLYLDGVEVGSTPKTGSLSTDPAVQVALGRQPAGAGNQPFLGAIDDVRIYRRALGQAEIAGLVNVDPPLPRVDFGSAGQSASEADGVRTVTVNLSQLSPVDVFVPFTVSGTAAPADYTIDASPLVIPAGQLSASITVTPIDDTDPEPSETVIVTMGTPSDSIPGAILEHTLTLLDDDTPGAFTSDDFNQCGLPGLWTLVDPQGDATLEVRGVGTDDAQVVLSVPSGVHDAFNTITAPYIKQSAADTDFEVEVKFDSAVVGSIQDQGILVLQDDLNWLRFDVYSTGSTANIFAASTVAGTSTIRINGGIGTSADPVWLRVSRAGDQWSLSWSFDGVSFTPAGSFSHSLAVQDLGIYSGNSGPAHSAVIDYVFETGAPVAPEDGVPPGLTGYALGIATTGNGGVSLDPAQALYYCDEDVELTAVADPGWTFDRWEGDLTGSTNPATVSMTAARSVTAVFVEDGGLPIAQFTTTGQNAPEAGPAVTLTVSLSAPAAGPVTVPYTVGGTASQPADYTIDASPLVIPAGLTSGDITLTPADDALVDPGETVLVTLGTPTGATLGTNVLHTVTILDDEGVQIVSDDFNSCALGGQWTFVDGGGDGAFWTAGPGTADAQLFLSVPEGIHDAYGTLGVPYVVQDVPDTDFEIEVKFDSQVSGSVQDQGVLVLEDTQNWLRFDFYSQSNTLYFFCASTIGGVSTSQANINLGPSSSPTWMRVTRTGDLWDISWSSNGTSFSQVFNLVHDLSAQQAGVYAGNSGPAHTAIVDYFFDTVSPVSPEDGPVPGQTGYALNLTVLGNGSVAKDLDQAAYYCSEMVTLTATPDPGWLFDRWEGSLTGSLNPQTVTMTAQRDVTAVFLPDSNLPLVGFDQAGQSVDEDGSSIAIRVSLSETSASDVTVPYTLSGTASSPADYSVDASPLVITAGNLFGDIVLTPNDDSVDEPDETVVITLGTPTNGTLFGTTQNTTTINDDDLPAVQFAAASQNVGEAAGTTSITVQLTSASPVDVTVPYTVGGSASNPADYSIDASPLVILAGQTSGNIQLTPVNDAVTEPDETVVVTLGSPSGATLGAPAVHTATLLDDDGLPTVEFSLAGQNVAESAGTAIATVQLSAPATQLVTVPYTVGGSATLVDDFSLAPNPIVIDIGQSSADVTITIVNDTAVEGGETIVLTLGTPINADPGTITVHTATIVDDDSTGLVSDDFNAPNLRPDLWTFIDPLGDSSIQVVGTGTADAQLILSVPEGRAHEAWTPLNVPRVMQPTPDTDLDIVAKFESNLTTAYQNDGLIFDQEDGLNWVRFDFRYDGSNLQAYASRTVNNVPATMLTLNLAAGPWNNPSPLYMRITRVGDDWTYRYSFDGSTWNNVGSFTQSLQLASVGPFCGNAGFLKPAHSTVVDYVFDFNAPINPEDVGFPTDTTPPLLYRSATRVLNDTSIEVTWSTDELATGALEYGTTTSYELGFWGTTQPAAHDHSFLVAGLLPDTEYHFRIHSEDPSANTTFSGDLTATTFPTGFSESPTFTFFYGQDVAGENHQRFGHLGRPQTWVNILGNVVDLNGSVTALSYRVNGAGAPNVLSMGPDILWDGPYRLELPGDFNAEIDADDLLPGMNQIIFSATDNEGNESTEICHVDYTTGVTWPDTYSIDWKTVTDIQDVAQVVDGQWEIVDDPNHAGEKMVRNTVPGYDRLIAIGDKFTWDNYEVTVPILVNQFNPAGFNPASNSYAVGFILRWPGHSGPETQQPRPGFFPFGGLFAYRWYPTVERWDHYGTDFQPNLASFQNPILVGVPMIMKARVQTLGDNTRLYQLRVWQEGQSEPAGWFFQATHGVGHGSDTGSLLLLSNYVDVSYGNITVTPLP